VTLITDLATLLEVTVLGRVVILLVGNCSKARDNECRQRAGQADMYKHFFGLRENPFNVNPDPRYLFLTSQTRDALDTLTCGIQTRKGLILLTGEVGTGKTTLINRLLDWLHQQQTPTAFIFNPHLETRHLFDFILADFGVSFDPRASSSPLIRLNQWLLERYRANENAVLIVDEAQGLSFDLLEEIRLLLNLETPHEKLLQVVLVGQPELEETLKRYELRQFRQRITLRCKTAPLTSEETRAYIQARLHIAGSNGKQVFAPAAINALHFYARGIPRVINLLCEHSLINAYVDNIQPVPAGIVVEVAHEFQFDDAKRSVPPADFGDVADAQSISMKSSFANVPTFPPSAAEPTGKAQSARGITCASVPIVVAKSTTLPNCESGTPSLACERSSDRIRALEAIGDAAQEETERLLDSTEFTWENVFRLLSELALESQAIASAPPPHVVESRSDFDHSVASQGSSASRPNTSAPRLITNDATMQTSQGSSEKQIRKLRAWPIRWSASWPMDWSSITSSPGRTQIISYLLRWLEPVMKPVQLTHRRWLAWRNGSSSMALPGMIASLIRWLQQPCGQMPWRLPHLRAIHARGESSPKRF